MEANTNPVATLLQQALGLMSNNVSIPIVIDYEAITKAAIRAVKEEKMKIQDKILVTQNEAIGLIGKSVVKSLVDRKILLPYDFDKEKTENREGKLAVKSLVNCGALQQYKFDTRDALDREGNPVKKAKGVVYYRLSEIERAIEDGNILKGTRRGTI